MFQVDSRDLKTSIYNLCRLNESSLLRLMVVRDPVPTLSVILQVYLVWYSPSVLKIMTTLMTCSRCMSREDGHSRPGGLSHSTRPC